MKSHKTLPFPAWKNKLFYGDNLSVLRQYIDDESVDLVYLDPPFNSNANYNILFHERDGTRAASQMKAFGDAWRWDAAAAAAYQDTIETAPVRVAETLRAFKTMLGGTDMLAYLAMMAPRLVELRRVLRASGSLYLHCDPTASHYLKLLLDATFGSKNFRSEVIWKRTSSHNSAKRWGPVHDVILFYTKGDNYLWNRTYQPYDVGYISAFYRHEDHKGRYRLGDLTGAGLRTGDSGRPWRGVDPSSSGRHWAVPAVPGMSKESAKASSVQDRLNSLEELGLIYWPPRGRVPQFKRYYDPHKGVPAQDLVIDIAPLSTNSLERLAYPTQKPEELLRRIITASSPENGVVLDPFCGCGTAVSAAESTHRKWIGIDVTQAAIVVIKQQRLAEIESSTYEVVGEPVSVPDAEALAAEDPYQFQWWAVGLLSARPIERVKGKDRGIDGRLYFHDAKGETRSVLISVKAGHLQAGHVRDLRGVLAREEADIAVMVSKDPPTRDMRAEAASAGFYSAPWQNKRYPRMQFLTIADLIAGVGVDMPPADRAVNTTFRKGPGRAKGKPAVQEKLFGS